ncbi:50S ribosomal protein L11 methyltransferase [candidate division KSB1 bacterium]|nr:50S ribosomal protein L11 methyltransferase [candidate division KSB1 bacterium]
MKAQDFLQIRVQVHSEIADVVSNFLFENGAYGIAEQENDLLAYFDGSIKEEDLLRPLFTYLNSLRELVKTDFDIVVATEIVPQRDWSEEWKKTLHPVRITENMVVKPSWLDPPAPAPPVLIEIDPEMAFGSGGHSTTRMMLRLIEKNVHSAITLLDVGTGSGILAIAALMLGADTAFAFDIDAIAAQTARRNADKNGVSGRFYAFAGTLDAVRDQHFDLILANINRTQILKMLKRLYELLAPGGLCLLSGILDSEEEMIRNACRQSGLTIETSLSEQEWLAFETRKR